MKILFIYMTIILLTGCGHAWVISQHEDSGVIGYKGYDSSDSAAEDIRALIPCSNFKIVSDDLRAQSVNYTAIQPVTTYSNSTATVYGPRGTYYGSGQTQQTSYVPTQQSGTEQWREATYECQKSSREALAENLNKATDSSLAEQTCEDKCAEMSRKDQLKAGMNARGCIIQLCKRKPASR